MRSSPDRSSWMEALMDLAPEPKEIVINQQKYLLDWDDIITIPEKNETEQIDMDNKCKIGIYNKENINNPISWITLHP